MDNFDLMRITVGPFSTWSLHTTFLMEFNNHFFEIGKDAAELLNYLKENGCDEVAVDTYVESHDGHAVERRCHRIFGNAVVENCGGKGILD